MWWREPLCTSLLIKKLISAPPGTGATKTGSDNDVVHSSTARKLYWFKCKLNGQLFDALLDSAATICCIARRCVSSNSVLRKLPVVPYVGPPLLDANRRPLAASGKIKLSFVAGSPALCLDVSMVIVDDLPYSCIVGTSLLSKLKNWGVDNVNSILSLNSSIVHLSDSPQVDDRVNLITSCKTTFLPGETKTIRASVRGPGISASRPYTQQLWMTEGISDREDRSSLRVFPSLNVIGEHNQNTTLLRVTNTSKQRRALGKGTAVALGNTEFGAMESVESLNALDGRDVVDILCDREELKHLSDAEYSQVKDMLSEFKDILVVSNEKIGRAKDSFFDIDTSTLEPVAVPLRRIPIHKQKIVEELMKHYEDLGLVDRVESPFRAATVLVEKKNPGKGGSVTDSYRICVDYRVLNKQLVDSAWPAPAIDHCLDAARGSVFLSSLDFNNGYYQIPCTDSAKYALAFSPGVGFPQYSFNGMPPGVKPAASAFQRTMEKTFRGLEDCILPPYFDDINIKGKSFKCHLDNCRAVLTRIRDSGFTLNALKCKFFRTRLKYLGHIIENGMVSIDPERVSAIINASPPHDTKSLRRFIGMAQFCSRFIRNLNDKMCPLYQLLRKGVKFNWNEECQAAFDYVKTCLSSAPVLRSPSASDTFILETDASDTGIGCCLKTVTSGSAEYLVGFHSEKLNDPESRWHIVEKEAYSILKGVEKFRHYLLGKKFTLKTDSRILSFMKTSKSKKLSNWALKLSDFDFEIIHIPSSNNAISDYLSRLHEDSTVVNVLSTFCPSFSDEVLLDAQKSDAHIQAGVSYVNDKKNFDVNSLGALRRYRKMLHVSANGILFWKTKIVLPKKLRAVVLRSAHDHPMSGHFAEDRTWSNVTRHFFWPGAQNDVVNWVKSCRACNGFAVSRYVNRPLIPIESMERFELVCYDLAGPFVPSAGARNLYALIIVDHFSKWPEIVPLTNIRAPTIANAIYEQWCCRYGVMTQLHSDGAPNVHGEVLKELCAKIGTVKSKSSRLHPQGDGLAEAAIKIMKYSIRKQVEEYGKDWDTYLQPTAFAMRSAVNSGTKCTPAELVLGDNLVRPIDVSVPQEKSTPFAKKQAKEFAQHLSKKIAASSDAVNANLAKSRREMKKTYDRKNSHHQINVGDHVMLWWPYTRAGIPRKFQPQWKGPFVVKHVIGTTNCTIELSDGSYKPVHMNQLKTAQTRNPERWCSVDLSCGEH